MFAYNDMDTNKFIIRRDDSTTDFFRKWDELLTSAKAATISLARLMSSQRVMLKLSTKRGSVSSRQP